MTGIVVVYSGGLDSTVLLTQQVRKVGAASVRAVSFDYGQRHGRKELGAARDVTDRLGVRWHKVDVSTLAEHLPGSSLTDATVAVPDGHYAEQTMKATVVPNRNLIMISIAAGIAEAHDYGRVVVAVHAGDHFIYHDCRPDFIDAAHGAVMRGTNARVRLDAPFVNMTKTDIARLGHEIDAPVELSWSCYKGGEIHCGSCGTCVERREAFTDAGVHDPTRYAATPTFAAP